MDRVILHCDLNAFYASCEALYHPEYKGLPLAVGGDPAQRQGIILAKNQLAKEAGVQTGEAIWQAKKKCPGLIVVLPDYEKYHMFSHRVRQIFLEYTDLVEPFGLDEAWLDVTGSQKLFGDGKTIADTIRKRIRDELGITASVGVSDNKIFAKLGSDYKKPDATTCITKQNKKQIVDPLPVSDLLNVGRATAVTLHGMGIRTIGDLSNADRTILSKRLGKAGDMLWTYANGLDPSEVRPYDYHEDNKSFGHTVTPPKDLTDIHQIRPIFYILTQDICCQMRAQNVLCRKVAIVYRDSKLRWQSRQCGLDRPSENVKEIAEKGIGLLGKSYDFALPLRSVGIRTMDFVKKEEHLQMSLFVDEVNKEKDHIIECTMETINNRFGKDCIVRCIALEGKDYE
ncbi:MAG: DNA polymerase IV [Erysipelotrichaceae bacterium]|nr:DNA polymerase IV [Erysipelotrichaceae bacterium]